MTKVLVCSCNVCEIINIYTAFIIRSEDQLTLLNTAYKKEKKKRNA